MSGINFIPRYFVYRGAIYKKGGGIVWQFPTKSTTYIAPLSAELPTSYCPCQIKNGHYFTNIASVSSVGAKYNANYSTGYEPSINNPH